MALLARSALCLTAVASGLEVLVHYPEQDSGVDRCGFDFQVSLSIQPFLDAGLDTKPQPTARMGQNLFGATVTLPDNLPPEHEVHVGVLANFDVSKIWNADCMATCPQISPQGQLVQTGRFTKVRSSMSEAAIHVWPAFCSNWVTYEQSYTSPATGREMLMKVRLPGVFVENWLPRPSGLLPPVLFRLNPEWFFPHPVRNFDTWDSLMDDGIMEYVAIAEVYVRGVNWQDWDTQPIYTTQKLESKCGKCDPDLQFVCDKWNAQMYSGGNHAFGSASAFFDELYEEVVPLLLRRFPRTTDDGRPRVGVWGYCIGGLAAWNALVTRPDRFSIAYLGSPAMDFDCGAPFAGLENITGGASRPKIYIDSGDEEGQLMKNMTRVLFAKLQERGLVDGRDVFYNPAEFGTHQRTSLLRRSLRGLVALFGAGYDMREVYGRALERVGPNLTVTNLTADLGADVSLANPSGGPKVPHMDWSKVHWNLALASDPEDGMRTAVSSNGPAAWGYFAVALVAGGVGFLLGQTRRNLGFGGTSPASEPLLCGEPVSA